MTSEQLLLLRGGSEGALCAQGLNFWKVPLQHQLLVANAATVADSTFLCWCARCRDDVTAVIPKHKLHGRHR